jgi:hypothetical protein
VRAELRKLEAAVADGRMAPGAAADRAIEAFVSGRRR